ncbi:MAG: DUF4142 domain-containing protein [Rhodospirillaceae bacterium]|jgi:putative membrane protein|nr:DUF4142 domain-containing protein [Rhodospirillaceae bacterium]MBT5564230.1 DUF4142 domain-containing protein [Rhodospirillaceae bacterium]MBT6088795.1 DUF4142 domain-containing protein [Rhodospirillaceae bacterium]MBT7449911.1 DUF4142 domain-containing protein [Rhodospirillaceae bacterium]
MSKLLAIAALTLLAITSTASAQENLNDLEIAHAAYTADLIDIRYAHIALAISESPEVREFAELMIRDHTAVNEGAFALLTKLNVAPQDNAFSQALLKGAADKNKELLSLRGAAFDKAYTTNELGYHQTVNKIVGEMWLPNVQTPELKAFLAQALVTFQVHEGHAEQIVKSRAVARR